MDEVLKQLLEDFLTKKESASAATDANNTAQAAAVNARAALDQAAADKESSRAALLQAITGA